MSVPSHASMASFLEGLQCPGPGEIQSFLFSCVAVLHQSSLSGSVLLEEGSPVAEGGVHVVLRGSLCWDA